MMSKAHLHDAELAANCAELRGAARELRDLFAQCLRNIANPNCALSKLTQDLRNVYAMFTQYSRNIYGMFTQYLRNITHSLDLRNIYVMSTQYLRNVYAIFT